MPEHDDRLLEKIKNSDEIAFKIIYKKYYPRLYYYILEFVVFKDIAENIIQDTFFTFWTKRKDLKENSNLSAYLFTVAKNNCLYRLRDQRYRQKLFSTSVISPEEFELNLEVFDSLDTSSITIDEIERIIKRTLDELPTQNRNVFILSRFHDRKNKEIAEELNISVKVVEKHITKSLKIFKSALKDYLPLIASFLIQ